MATPASRRLNLCKQGSCGERACLWRAGLPRVGLRSSPSKDKCAVSGTPWDWFWGCSAPQSGASPLATGRFAILEFAFSLSFSRQRRSTRRHRATAAGGFIRRSKAQQLNPGKQGSCGERACPALGCEAAPVKTNALYQALPGAGFGAAPHPNAGQARSPRGVSRSSNLHSACHSVASGGVRGGTRRLLPVASYAAAKRSSAESS